MGLPGNGRLFFPTRRVILQPRGGRFCNYEEKNFATTRRLQNEWIWGILRAGGVASLRMLNYTFFLDSK